MEPSGLGANTLRSERHNLRDIHVMARGLHIDCTSCKYDARSEAGPAAEFCTDARRCTPGRNSNEHDSTNLCDRRLARPVHLTVEEDTNFVA
jgi:hypothetical protein